nr:EOG090X0IJO [Cyclestheria hislopi]
MDNSQHSFDENVVASDLPVAISFLNEIKEITLSINRMVQNIIVRIRNTELNMENGMSFFDVKNDALLSYLINLTFIICRKCSGDSIENHPVVERLVELRTILERIRPVEHKLRYQVDKLLRLAAAGKLEDSDPLQFKANPSNMITKIEGSSESEDEEGGEHKKPKCDAYIPPKLVAMHYDGDETGEQRATTVAEKTRRHALSASIMQGLKEEFTETPPEIIESTVNDERVKLAREMKERQEYEETYFTRLPTSRKDRHHRRPGGTVTSIAKELIGFEWKICSESCLPCWNVGITCYFGGSDFVFLFIH